MGSFFNLDNALQELVKNEKTPFFVQIGAMDGKSFDPLYLHIMRNSGLKGLLVEPLFMDQLKSTYAARDGLSFAEVAITDTDGACVMHRVKPGAPSWAKGCSYVTDHGKRHTLLRDQDIESISVPTRSLKTLFEENNVYHVDIWQSDTEGMDFKILKQLDFEKYRPSIINIEYAHLEAGEKDALKVLLKENGYLFTIRGMDITAVKPKLLDAMISVDDRKHYEAWVEKGIIAKGDLPYAIALLAEIAEHLTGQFLDSEPNVPLRSQPLLSNRSESTGQQHPPRFDEAMDAIDRLGKITRDKRKLFTLLEKELPPLALDAVKNLNAGVVRQ